MWTLSPEERDRVRQQFTSALANLAHLQVYWLASETRLVVRSVTAKKRHAIPAGAELIGVYSQPFGAREFLSDLDDLLARLAVEEQRRAQQQKARGDGQLPAFA